MPTDDRLKLVAHFDHQVTGVAATEDGRLFVNFPRWTDDAPISVAEVMPGRLELRPYPDANWNSLAQCQGQRTWRLREPLRLRPVNRARRQGQLCGSLDPGAPGNEKILPGAPKLVKIDLKTRTRSPRSSR